MNSSFLPKVPFSGNTRFALGTVGVLALAFGACATEAEEPVDPATGGSAQMAGAGTGGSGKAGSGPAGTGGVGPLGGASGSAGRGSGGAGVGGAGTGPVGGAGASVGGVGPMGGAAGTTAGVGPNGGAGVGNGGAGMAGGGVGGGAGTGGGTGGGGPTGPGLTDVNALTPATCTITPMVTPASAIPTVGVATFTTDLAGAERAIIQFGKTSTYTLEAPVDWAEPEHRTLLLGMPANTDVHYRVVVIQGNTACVGPDATYRTGAAVSGAPANLRPTRGQSPAEPAPGFIIAESTNFAYIINVEGEVVWAHRFPVSLTRALMSWDGKYMIARELGPFNASSGGAIYRVDMDGENEMKLNVSGGTHHDFTVTPTGIAYPAKQSAGGCDSLYTANYDGSNSRPLVDLEIVFGKFANGPGSAAMEECHVNAIHYYEDTDSYSLSDREKDAIAFISSTGAVLGSVGATPTSTTPNHAKAEGADSTTNSVWRVQHGHDLYEPNKLVVWSNGSFMGGQSKILHYTINGATATLDWQYGGTGNSPTLSDAQHLPNGNFLATCSQTGAVHEIDPNQMLVQSFSNLSRGYTSHRTTLYGRPSGR